MKLLAALIALFAIVANASACDCDKKADTMCLSEDQMAEHVLSLAMARDRMGNHTNIAGIAAFEISIGQEGKVRSAKALSGHPIAVSLLLAEVSKWRFAPAIRNKVAKEGCGLLRMRYSIVNNESSVVVARMATFHDCNLNRYQPIRISDFFTPANTLESAQPEYPPDVLARRINGEVHVRILINLQTGAVDKACAYSGPPELRGLAEEAATRFRFRKPPLGQSKYALDFLIFDFVLPENRR